MGVTGLWTVVAPTARPTQLATLNRKRLAVDASIWIYQFLKAVRDKEGNALRNSHVVGFFRRICKLLYFGIKPVFVFDGGAPVLKRETVRRRARRREGRREDAARTAGKLLAVQVQRAAEEEERKRREKRDVIEEELPEDAELVYVDELGMSAKERQQGRGFRKKDQYHLPDLEGGIESMGAPNDPRIMSQAELEDYARHFHSGEDINLYDFSKIDFESPFFMSLPPGDRYNILNAARLRSRLRMGYSKEQLDGMFPDRMAFSKFQIERVKERNELTQRLMHINGMADDFLDQGGRIAGEKGKEYVLVRNEGVEGGWALGVVSNKHGSKKENAIDLEDDDKSDEEPQASEEEDFEDIAIEGLNRLPKNWGKKRKEVNYDVSYEDAAAQIAEKRQSVYAARRKAAEEARMAQAVDHPAHEDADALFVEQDDDNDELFEDVDIEVANGGDEDEDLKRAIDMSVENPDAVTEDGGFLIDEDQPEKMDEEELDLQAALAESRKSKYQSKTQVRKASPPSKIQPKFGGPLPFESINLGQSLLGKKKSKKIDENLSGGFERDLGEDAFRKERPAQPVPSWFEADPNSIDRSRHWVEEEDAEDDHVTYGREDANRRETLRRNKTKEVIDLEAEDERPSVALPLEPDAEDVPQQEVLPIDLEDRESNQEQSPPRTPDDEVLATVAEDLSVEEAEKEKRASEREERYRMAREIAAENARGDINMEDVADHAQAEPPSSNIPNYMPQKVPADDVAEHTVATDDEEQVAWSESEDEQEAPSTLAPTEQPSGGLFVPEDDNQSSGSEDVFEDVETSAQAQPTQTTNGLPPSIPTEVTNGYLVSDDEEPTEPTTTAPAQPQPDDEFYISDSDEEFMRQMAEEAEEHARFASTFNASKPQSEALRDYETELKALRNQQKKDRRDADEVTQTMIQECQALLRLFGLPYITAPMEAEAQCAELVHLGLVDGIVTDDSDIFLFGGTRIYKNMFNAAKFVECYLSSDLEKEYALDRQKLVHFAHLLGSDYTEGIPGIGPVSALEIITEFTTLNEFREWCAKIQLGRPADLEAQLTTPFRRKFRNTAAKRLFLPTGFPDLRVDAAYLKPEVDTNPEAFQWGVPDLDKLRSYLMATIGWSQDRTDEILVPVVRDMNKREVEGTQANLTRFFQGSVGVGGRADGAVPRNRTGAESGRMKTAYKRLRGEAERKRREEGGEAVVEPDKVTNGHSVGDAVVHETTNGDGEPDTTTTRTTSAAKNKTARTKRKAPSAKSKAATTVKRRATTSRARKVLDSDADEDDHGNEGDDDAEAEADVSDVELPKQKKQRKRTRVIK